MSAFKDLPFEQRSLAMGDEAEGIFERVYERSWVRTGLRRPKILVSKLHPHIRHLPDYLTSEGWVEVVGCGQDQLVKLKIEKLEALQFWSLLMPVRLFVWDSSRERYALVPFADVAEVARYAELKRFPEGTWYAAVPASVLFNEIPDEIPNAPRDPAPA